MASFIMNVIQLVVNVREYIDLVQVIIYIFQLIGLEFGLE